MDDLVAFLRARLDEAEHRVHHGNDTWDGHDWHTAHCGWWTGEGIHDECTCEVPKFVLADIAAKRKIIGICIEMEGEGHGYNGYAELLLRELATPFASHPDYRKEWTP